MGVLKINDPFLAKKSREARHAVLFTFAWVVSAGYTIRNQLVRSATAKQYVEAAAEMIEEGNQLGTSPLWMSDTNQKWPRNIYEVLKSLSDWEDLPKRVEPVTKAMVRYMHRDKGLTGEDSQKALIRDFSILGLCTGFRSAEWNQDTKPRGWKRGQWDRKLDDESGPIMALMEQDLSFLTPEHKVIAEPLQADPMSIGYVRVTHRVQKNGENGQKVTHAANPQDTELCPVRAAVRIIARARRLGVTAAEPLAAYRQNKGSKEPTWVVKAQVAKYYEQVARSVYSIPEDTKVAYSGHSLRVGAAVLMYAGNGTGPQIQQRLRWKSDSFLKYLRDVPQAAIQHLNKLNETVNDHLPNAQDAG